jgi:hypothetical protein
VGERQRTGEQDFAVPICDPEGMAALMAMNRLNVGPGEPGPGDEWKFPVASADEVEGPGGPAWDSARPGWGAGLLQRLTHRG